jgi:hypothetical protein
MREMRPHSQRLTLVHRAAMITYNWADETGAELKTVLAPAAVSITFRFNGSVRR